MCDQNSNEIVEALNNIASELEDLNKNLTANRPIGLMLMALLKRTLEAVEGLKGNDP